MTPPTSRSLYCLGESFETTSEALDSPLSHPPPFEYPFKMSFTQMVESFKHEDSQHFPKNLDKNATVVPVGLDFGPSWVSVSFSVEIDGDQRLYFTGFDCGQVYKDFYQEALSKKVQDHLEFEEFPPSNAPLVSTEEQASELVEAFARHIEDARLMGVWSLDKNPALNFKVMAITLPDHWDDSARTVVAKAARLAGEPLDGPDMILKLPRAVQLAHEMQKDTAGTCLTILIHYHKSYLQLMLVQMCEAGCVMKGQVYLRHLGEDMILKASATDRAFDPDQDTLNQGSPSDSLSSGTPTSDGPLDENPFDDATLHHSHLSDEHLDKDPTPEPSTSTHSPQDNTDPSSEIYTEPPVYQYPDVDLEPIREALQKFILLMTRSDEPTPPKGSPPSLKHAVNDVKYIVLDGTATPRGQEALRTVIKEMFADTDWINLEMNLQMWGEYGAEIAGRRQWENPKHVGDWKESPGYLDG